MKLVIKAIFLQCLWFFAVIGGPVINDSIICGICFLFVFFNYFFYRPRITFFNYIICIGMFSIYGLTQDLSLYFTEIISFKEGYYPFWILSLYIIFIGYFGDLFNYLQKLPTWSLSILGGLGGAFAYLGGMELGSIYVARLDRLYFLIIVFIGWSIFFPLSLYLFSHLSVTNNKS